MFAKDLHFHFSLSCIGEGNGNPLQCSYLENPRDGEAWWAAVYGVAQSQTRLKQLSSSSSGRRTKKQTYGDEQYTRRNQWQNKAEDWKGNLEERMVEITATEQNIEKRIKEMKTT